MVIIGSQLEYFHKAAEKLPLSNENRDEVYELIKSAQNSWRSLIVLAKHKIDVPGESSLDKDTSSTIESMNHHLGSYRSAIQAIKAVLEQAKE